MKRYLILTGGINNKPERFSIKEIEIEAEDETRYRESNEKHFSQKNIYSSSNLIHFDFYCNTLEEAIETRAKIITDYIALRCDEQVALFKRQLQLNEEVKILQGFLNNEIDFVK